MTSTALRDGPGASLGYPFTSKQDADACPCLADIQVMWRTAAIERLAVTLANSSPALILVNVATGNAVFDSRDVTPQIINKAGLRLVQWTTDDVVVCMTVDISVSNYAGPPLTLCDRPIYPGSDQLESLVIESTTGDVEIDTHRARFEAGYNCELTVEDQTLIVAAAAGSGLGQYQDCLDELNAVRSIARSKPSAAGNIQLASDDCIRVSPELIAEANGYSVSPGRWYLHDDCEECCRCEEKAAVWLVAKDLQDKLAGMIARYQTLRSEYNRRVTDIQTGDNCTARPLLNVDLIADINNQLSMYITICNGTNKRIDSIQLKVSPFVIRTGRSSLNKRHYLTTDPEFFTENPGMIMIPDEDGYFYSLHEALRGDHRINFVPECGRGYIYSVGGKNHIKQPGTVGVVHHPFDRASYRVVRHPITNRFDILHDGGLELEFQCLEPGDTRYLTISIFPSIPVGQPGATLESTNLAFLVYSTTHDEINVSAKSGFGFGIPCASPEEE